MAESTDSLTLWILLSLFATVGIYLLWYMRRRRKMLEAFARAHQFPIRPSLQNELQTTLERFFPLEDSGLVRSFGQLSSIIDAGPVRLFRAVELLDLNPHAQASSTHFARIASLFEVPKQYDAFFLLDRSKDITNLLPAAAAPANEIIELIKQSTAICRIEHTLSVTLKNGYGLIYFEPLVTGGETLADVESLYAIAEQIQHKLNDQG